MPLNLIHQQQCMTHWIEEHCQNQQKVVSEAHETASLDLLSSSVSDVLFLSYKIMLFETAIHGKQVCIQ